MTAILGATFAERREALQAGAALLRSVWPKVTTDGHVRLGPNAVHVRFTMEFSGVIRVVCRYTGQLVAQSLPGQHRSLDPAVHTDLFAPFEAQDLLSVLRRDMGTPDAMLLIADALEDRSFSACTLAEVVYVIREWADQLS